jgi:hypothetical protein
MATVGMLAVMGMLIWRSRDPDMWRWLERDREAAPAADQGQPAPLRGVGSVPQAAVPRGGVAGGQAAPAPALPASPKATGPTDQDPEEIEFMKEALQAVNDKTVETTRVEMIPYQRIVEWVLHQPFELLRQRASPARIARLLNAPDEYRAKLFSVRLDVQRVLRWDLKMYGPDQAGKKDPQPRQLLPLYETFGTAPGAGNWPFMVILVDVPKGMPLGEGLQERIQFAGYFFKVQKYIDRLHRENLAPVLIGRAEWVRPEPIALEKTDWVIGSGVGTGLALVALGSLAWALLRRKGRSTRLTGVPRPGAAMALEQWIDQAEGTPADGRPGEAPEPGLASPGPGGNGHGDGLAHPLSRGLDGHPPPGE